MMLNESRRSRAHFDLPLALMVFGLAGFGVLSVAVATFSTSSEVEGTLLNYIVASYYGCLLYTSSPRAIRARCAARWAWTARPFAACTTCRRTTCPAPATWS